MVSGDADSRHHRAGLLQRLAGFVCFRIHQWFHFLLLPLVGFEPAADWSAQLFPMGRGVGIAFLLLSFGYLINGYADRNTGKRLVVEPASQRRLLLIILWLLPALALGLSLTGPPVVWLSTAVVCLSGVFYSIGPALKSYPVIGSLMNVTNFMPLMFLGFGGTEALARNWPLIFAFGGLLLGNQIIHEAADQKEDTASGIRTTFLWLGAHLSAVVCALLGLGVAAGVFFSPIPLAPLPAGVCLALFAVALPYLLGRYGTRRRAMVKLRILHRWLSLGAGAAIYLLLKLCSG